MKNLDVVSGTIDTAVLVPAPSTLYVRRRPAAGDEFESGVAERPCSRRAQDDIGTSRTNLQADHDMVALRSEYHIPPETCISD